MNSNNRLKLGSFLKDKDGRVVLWQQPNVLLCGWIVFKVLALTLAKGHVRHGFEQLSTAFLFAWAFLEFTNGVNYFRRLLGLLVLAALIMSYFK